MEASGRTQKASSYFLKHKHDTEEIRHNADRARDNAMRAHSESGYKKRFSISNFDSASFIRPYFKFPGLLPMPHRE